MKKFILLALIIFALQNADAQTGRQMAVTIDDLPVVVKNSRLELRQRITKKLLKHIKGAKIPAIGFVNENKLYVDGKRSKPEVDLLRQWLDAGFELGNHTYSHLSLNRNPLEKYEEEILRGETITKELLGAKNKPIRYFRHPFLQTGLDLKTKEGLAEFLSQHKYTVAPVSIDNADWIFARAFDNAIEKKDEKLKKRIAAAYVPYLEAKTDYWERQSVKLFGREIRQILLLHANSINSEHFDDVARMFKKRGYKFITLEEALKDEAYGLPDNFTRNAGISWLHRWALDRGREFVLGEEPAVPDFVMKAAGVDSE
ncbi:MAG: polysaccharide deacetylase family protein [Pyrinomonadaceae bacterium]